MIWDANRTDTGPEMKRELTLEYWLDDGWYVGRLREVPGVYSQGESLAELEQNIEDAYQLVRSSDRSEAAPKSALESL